MKETRGNLALVPDFMGPMDDLEDKIVQNTELSQKRGKIEPFESQEEKNRLIQTAAAMSDAEQDIMLDAMPIEKVLGRITRELDKQQRFNKAIKEAFSIIS